MKNEMIKFVKELKDVKCYTIITNEGCLLHAKGNEALSMLACLVNSLSEDIPRKAIEDAVKLGFEDKKDIDKTAKDIEKLTEALKKLGELLDE